MSARKPFPQRLLTDGGFRNAYAGTAYALAGSFVKYLISRFGYRRFATFYRLTAQMPGYQLVNYESGAGAAYKGGFKGLFRSWQRYLCRAPC